MADFNTLERSRESSRPAELYEFTIGSAIYRYTTAEDEITVGAPPETFVPQPGMSRGRIERSTDQRNRELSITVPSDNEVAVAYSSIAPVEGCDVRAFRIQRDETPTPLVVLLFDGKLSQVSFSRDGVIANLVARSVESDLEHNLPRFTYTSSCNNFLYDQFCKVDPAAHNHTGVALSASGATVTVNGAGAAPHDFVGGFIRVVTGLQFRQVINQSGDLLYLDVPFVGDVVGLNLQVYAGCDRLLEGDCALTFDNVIEFSGFAWGPNKNVFQTGLL